MDFVVPLLRVNASYSSSILLSPQPGHPWHCIIHFPPILSLGDAMNFSPSSQETETAPAAKRAQRDVSSPLLGLRRSVSPPSRWHVMCGVAAVLAVTKIFPSPLATHPPRSNPTRNRRRRCPRRSAWAAHGITTKRDDHSTFLGHYRRRLQAALARGEFIASGEGEKTS